MVQLKKIDRENVWDVARLKVKRAQMNYVSSNVESILEAFATREAGGIAAPFALCDGAAFVGFAMIGYGDLPVCIAKTQYSFSDNAKLTGAPTGFTMEVREVRLAAGAGFVVVICGSIMTMPGLPKKPAAMGIDVDADGKITGLF